MRCRRSDPSARQEPENPAPAGFSFACVDDGITSSALTFRPNTLRTMDRPMARVLGNRLLLLLALCAVLAAACRREAPAPEPAGPAPATTTAAPPPAVQLKDVSERDPRYIVGISYPPTVNKYPGLAAELKKYSDAARAELQQAIDGLGTEPPSAPYDLSLSFTQLVETPGVVAIAADGSSY